MSRHNYSFEHLRLSIDDRGVARLVLDRPKVNAFGPELIADITEAFRQLEKDGTVRAVVLAGAGKVFSAGGDLNWMRAMADYSREENIADAMRLAHMLETMHHVPKPLIGRIHGAAIGGGCGLTAVCDVAVAAEGATFAFTEITLGLRPSTISSYCIPKLGDKNAEILFSTGQIFNADEAQRYGLVDEVASAAALDGVIDTLVERALREGKQALRQRSGSIRARRATVETDASFVPDHAISALVARATELLRDSSPQGRRRLMEFTAADLADARGMPDTKEKIRAFLNASHRPR